ncbi:MAG: molecular chaperone DnaK, partial [Chloroflexi bacterium]|nr:molecular chaperone DnaK [Chloroflexota bacterium]
PADAKSKAEDKVKALRDLMNGDNLEAIRQETDALSQILQTLGAGMYQQNGPETPPQAGQTGGAPEGGTSGGSDGGDDVVDGEFRNA